MTTYEHIMSDRNALVQNIACFTLAFFSEVTGKDECSEENINKLKSTVEWWLDMER